MSRSAIFLRTLLLTTSALAAIFGWYQLFRFAATPGEQSAAPARLPQNWAQSPSGAAENSLLHPVARSNSPLLLVFIHPQCSCTHATLDELDQILHDPIPHDPIRDAAGNTRLASTQLASTQIVLAVYHSPTLDRSPGLAAFTPATWLHAPFRLLTDTGGRLARRFGAATSGEIVLYAADGHLLFQGGITPERAHVGASPASAALRAALLHGTPQTRGFSVFGCSIFNPQRAE